jgi:hypothetical protein
VRDILYSSFENLFMPIARISAGELRFFKPVLCV